MKAAYGERALDQNRQTLLYHFCRVQLPGVALAPTAFERHLKRAYELYRAKSDNGASEAVFLDNLYPLDWYLASACLDGDNRAWEALFAARTSRADCLLVDALRARAVRLYPRDEERQENAVVEFWSHLLVPETPGSLATLARFDGQRPLVPWLIRVFQNWHISQLRHHSHAAVQALPDDDLAAELPVVGANGQWHEAFCLAAREWLGGLPDNELLILGLRLRYRLSQREVANLLGVHEGTISRQTTQLRDRCLEAIGQQLITQGWTGDDLSEYILNEMGSLLMDEPRLSADALAALLHAKGIKKVKLGEG
ncbi:MAG: sigma-70 family RNA polymerase sigma factor [Planctomycetia bacterium]|nr:sigma-70 family RNA polymerase sigma factor [Planctomycetia bacterium]